MHRFDIISPSPNLYLFQKESNKTNFGGFLFLIYLVIIILVFVYYIIDYVGNEKYTIQSFNHFNIKTDEEIEKRNMEVKYNPNIYFKIQVNYTKNRSTHDITNYFKLYDYNRSEFLDNYMFTDYINTFDYALLFKCDDNNCSNYFDLITNLSKKDIDTFDIIFNYEGFALEHQNPDRPIKKGGYINEIYPINFNTTVLIVNGWRNIIYTQKKELFHNGFEDHCGYIFKYNSYYFNRLQNANLKDELYIVICYIYFYIDHTQYTEYIRARVSEVDIVANVLSLMANIFAGASFILGFYINNFNNFKIIEKILNKEQTKKIKIKKPPIQMHDLENDKTISLKEYFDENDLKKEKEKDNYIDNIITESEEKEEDILDTDTKRIKKLHFFDFFMNNCYFCYKKRKEQKIIHYCNEIVYKYSSIDNLIKNQIIVDNLLKDYKWNDPALNNVENNNLVIQLKTYL